MPTGIISIISNRSRISLSAADILYIRMLKPKVCIHLSNGRVVECYATLRELEDALGGGFLRTDRATLVSARAIHDIGKQIELVNGETLSFTRRRKRELKEQLRVGRQQLVHDLADSRVPLTHEEYQRHYASYDALPIAFTDIEMIFNAERAAVDWIFRYGNEALARLEKTPLEALIDHTFSSIFPNMDAKWLRVYERTALYGEKLEISAYSPEIDTDLKIICFPTFRGHCGCILFDRNALQQRG